MSQPQPYKDGKPLHWIDIQGKAVHRFNPRSRNDESFPLPEKAPLSGSLFAVDAGVKRMLSTPFTA